MKNKTDSAAPSLRRSWVVDARRRLDIIKDGRHYHWRTRIPKLKSWLRAAVLFALIAADASRARAAFDVPSISAQSAALGGSSLPDRGDPAALFLNPAAGAGLKSAEAYLMYNQLYTGLGVGGIGQGFTAVGVPTKLGVVGIGYSDFRASGLLEERMVGVTFSRKLSDALQAGVTGKYLYHRYLIGSDPLAAADPVFSGGAARGAFSLDAGLIASFARDWTLGLAVRNVNAPDIGLATPDPVPREFQAGLAYRVSAWDLRATADYTYRAVNAGTFQAGSRPGVGLEKSFAGNRVKFRVGASLDQFSGGVGVDFGPFGLDYTFILPRVLYTNNAGTHMFGLRYRFGEAAPASQRGDRE